MNDSALADAVRDFIAGKCDAQALKDALGTHDAAVRDHDVVVLNKFLTDIRTARQGKSAIKSAEIRELRDVAIRNANECSHLRRTAIELEDECRKLRDQVDALRAYPRGEPVETILKIVSRVYESACPLSGDCGWDYTFPSEEMTQLGHALASLGWPYSMDPNAGK